MLHSDSEIIELFYLVMRSSVEHRRNSGNPFSGQYRCLFMLDKVKEISQHRLSEILEIRPTSLSEILRKLEKKGYVLRSQLEGDKRTFSVSLTKAGREEVQRVRKERMKNHLELTASLSIEEKEELYRILKKIRDYQNRLENEVH